MVRAQVVPVRSSVSSNGLNGWQKTSIYQLHLAAARPRIHFVQPLLNGVPLCRHRCFHLGLFRPSLAWPAASRRPAAVLCELRRRFLHHSNGRRAHRLAKERPPLCCNGRCSGRASPTDQSPLHRSWALLTSRTSRVPRSARLDPALQRDFDDFRGPPRSEVVPTLTRKILGIDAGSTTMKAVLVAERASFFYTWYDNNNGDILELLARSWTPST